MVGVVQCRGLIGLLGGLRLSSIESLMNGFTFKKWSKHIHQNTEATVHLFRKEKKFTGEKMKNKIVHFIGFDGDGFAAAVKVFGHPDFIHKFFDRRSLGDIDFDNDTVVFGRKTKLTPHPIWVDQDHNRH